MSTRTREHRGLSRVGVIALVAGYIGANAVANLVLIATPIAWRALASIGIALLFVALDITTRDKLDDLWGGDRRKLATLIIAGSAISAALNYAAWPVAVASCAAFAASGAADTVVYHRLRRHSWLQRANGSNLVSAFVDSGVFLSLAAALGVLPWVAVPVALVGQFLAKSVGGFVWSLVLRP